MSVAETTISYSTESIGVGGELVIRSLPAHSQNETCVWGLRFPTNFRHQLCIVVHCRAKSQQTPSFRPYRSITYNGSRATNRAVGSSHRDRRSWSTDAEGEAAQLPFHLSGRAKYKRLTDIGKPFLFAATPQLNGRSASADKQSYFSSASKSSLP